MIRIVLPEKLAPPIIRRYSSEEFIDLISILLARFPVFRSNSISAVLVVSGASPGAISSDILMCRDPEELYV